MATDAAVVAEGDGGGRRSRVAADVDRRSRPRKARRADRSSAEKARTLAFFGLIVPFWLLVALLPANDPRKWMLLGGVFGGVLLTILSSGRILEREERRRRERTTESLEARGESTLGGDFVGVGYGDGAWTYRDVGRHLDEGILRLDLDRIAFVGRDTRFELPVDAVVGTEIRRHEGGLGDRACLYVHWAHAGEAGTLSLEMPYRRSLRQRIHEIADLRDRIERWSEPFPRRTASPLLPITVQTRKWINPNTQIGSTAKFFAGAALIFELILLTIGGDLALSRAGFPELGHRLGGSAGSLCGVV